MRGPASQVGNRERPNLVPRAPFPGFGTFKAREKRPGDEVERERAITTHSLPFLFFHRPSIFSLEIVERAYENKTAGDLHCNKKNVFEQATHLSVS